ncbi:MAG: sigma-70 family RNA polymerase sigma factor, partial [Chloroflexi bacterium]|nr:sigma-70 family RNA polymerase sigma factor [Chloroflexota bacterium]
MIDSRRVERRGRSRVRARRPTGAVDLEGVAAPVDDPARLSHAPRVPGGPADAKNAEPSARERALHLQHARDRALVEQAQRGDLEAFNQLVELYQGYLFTMTYRVVNDRESAADAVQEAFFSAYRNLDRFRGDSFRSWLTRIALNAATDILRLRKRRPADPYPEWEDDSWQPPTDEADGPERAAIQRARVRA